MIQKLVDGGTVTGGGANVTHSYYPRAGRGIKAATFYVVPVSNANDGTTALGIFPACQVDGVKTECTADSDNKLSPSSDPTVAATTNTNPVVVSFDTDAAHGNDGVYAGVTLLLNPAGASGDLVYDVILVTEEVDL